MTISVLVVDDEPIALARLERLVNAIDGVELAGRGVNGQQAIDLVELHKPDVLLIDIEMPGINGLDAVAKILVNSTEPPAVIFCTAYDQYAIDAFSTNAVGYLLKPVDGELLETKLLDAKRLTRLQLNSLQAELAPENSIPLSHDGALHKLTESNVCYFRSEGKAVVAGLENSDEAIVDFTLKHLEEIWNSRFIRVHRSALVNKQRICRLEKNEQGQNILFLDNSDMTFPVSRRHLSQVKKCFK